MIGNGIAVAMALFLVGTGLFALVNPEKVGEKISSFYRSYPLMRYADDRQFRTRNGFVRAMGLCLAVLGLLAIGSVL